MYKISLASPMNLFFSRPKRELLTHPLAASSPLSMFLWTCCKIWAALVTRVGWLEQYKHHQLHLDVILLFVVPKVTLASLLYVALSYIFCGPGHFGHVTLISVGWWLLDTCLMIQWEGAGILLFFSSALAWACQKIFALRIIVWIIFKALEILLLTLWRQYKTFSLEEWGWRSIFQERSYNQTSVLKV